MPGDRQVLPAAAAGLLEQLANALQEDQLRLFGGAALDLLAEPWASCHDLDVVLPMSRLADFKPTKDVEVFGQPRPYRIRHSVPVIIRTARWQGWALDLNFLDDVGAIGHFDIERVCWHFPDYTFSDPHGAAFTPVRSFRLVTALDSDNPLLLMNRVVKLAAKYNVPFWQQRHLVDLITQLSDAAAAWTPTDPFHGWEAHAAHLRALAGSVRRARQPHQFLNGCLQAGVLSARLGPLAAALRRAPSASARLTSATSDELFWQLADDLIADGSADWRQYRGESRCGSVS